METGQRVARRQGRLEGRQAPLTFTDIPDEERSWLYLLRLAAFALILVSIGFKNRRQR